MVRPISKPVFGALLAGGLLFASAAVAADKTYQVTGPVVSVTSDSIVVKKGKDDWTIAKDASTKSPDVKPGDKVTVYYKMTATEIEAKPAAAAKTPAKKK
jgi:RNase P/RNase MRP subunit p29